MLVMRTLSKLGLAGLRLGYVAGRREWMDEFNKLRLPYNINSLTQKSVKFFLDHIDVMNRQADQIVRDRDRLIEEMKNISGFTVWPSATNFVLFRNENIPGVTIYNGLKKQDVLVKNLHGSHPSLANCLRVTVGTTQECETFLSALKNSVH